MEFHEIENFFFDLDGTIWNWDKTKPGTSDLLETIEKAGRNAFFHTDNTILSREEYCQRLEDKGIKTEKENLFTAGIALSKKLVQDDVRKVYVSGEQGIIQEIESAGIKISEESENAVLGFDRQFNYDKLSRLMKIAGESGKIYICSTEEEFIRSRGSLPHQEPLNRAVREFGDTRLVGKPSKAYQKAFKDYFDFRPENSMMIGDRLEDIETGNRIGMKTGAVLHGVLDEEDLRTAEEIEKPDYVITSLEKLKRRII